MAAPLVAEHGSGCRGSGVMAHRLSSSTAGHQEPGIKPVSPALPGRFLTAEPPGKSPFSSALNDVLAGTGEGEEGPGEDV